jgi:hypothetical protein
MTRAQLLTGTLLDGASPLASVGRCDMLGLPPVLPGQVGWSDRVAYGGHRSGKTEERMRHLAGLRSDRKVVVVNPA